MEIEIDKQNNLKGVCKQEGIPTPDKPVNIETITLGKNIFEGSDNIMNDSVKEYVQYSTKPSYLKEFAGHYVLLEEILKRAVDTKKIDDFERYIDKFIELYVNTIGATDETEC